LDEQQSHDNPNNLQGNDYRDIRQDSPPNLLSPVKSGNLYKGEGQRGNKGQRSPGHIASHQQKLNPTSVSDNNSGCFQKANRSDAKASSQIIGRLSDTTTKTYPHGSGIVTTHYGICFGKTQKPKFISNGNTVITYDPLPRRGQFSSPILSFIVENGQENEFDMD
jgi:hypothetical protein